MNETWHILLGILIGIALAAGSYYVAEPDFRDDVHGTLRWLFRRKRSAPNPWSALEGAHRVPWEVRDCDNVSDAELSYCGPSSPLSRHMPNDWRYRTIVATFAPKRTDDLQPGVAEWIGRRLTWMFDTICDWNADYEGQWTLTPRDHVDRAPGAPMFPAAWVPFCDLADIEGEVPPNDPPPASRATYGGPTASAFQEGQ